MITDAELRFSNAQAITTGATNSTNVIDLATTADISRSGGPLRCVVEVTTTFTSGGSGTLQFQLVQSASPTLSSPDVLFDSTALAKTVLIAGYRPFDFLVPPTSKRYLGIIYTVAVADMTTGAVFAGLVENTETAQASRIIGNTSLS